MIAADWLYIAEGLERAAAALWAESWQPFNDDRIANLAYASRLAFAARECRQQVPLTPTPNTKDR